jgi:G3E family GTPase
MDRLADAPEAEDQVAFADVIVLNKTDLVSAAELAEVEATIRQLNPYARIHRTQRSAVALDAILDKGAFDLERVLSLDPEFLSPDEHGHDHDHVCGPDCDHDHHHHDHGHHDHHHHHDHAHGRHDTEVTSVSLKAGELDPNKILAWIGRVTQEQGPNILRLKGILAFPDEPKRYVVQGVHMIVEGDLQRDWRADEPRESRLVFIGRKLDARALKAEFDACAA